MRFYIPSAAIAAAAAVCVAIMLLLLQQLLFVIVCRVAKIVPGSFNLIPSGVSFLFIQMRFNYINNVCTPFAVLSHLRP